ncbi:MAG: AAA family ATPase [Candidatus Peribacteraceae bacterium]|nr:AAA family ATPase [Candidatus Peribacteraceae bacterium]
MVEKYLWVEKYRPQTVDDMILQDEYRQMFNKFINEKEIPHLLFHGPPGSGKTAMAKILIKSMVKDKNDVLSFNGSTSTGIDIVRDSIEDFLKTPTFGGSKIKVVFIDEFDYMSQNAQAALRNITETYHENGRFIFTCNYLYKVIDPLQSRCQSFEFKRLPKEYVVDFCKNILDKEGIKYEDLSISKITTTFFPDIRKIINTLQSRCEGGELIIKGSDLESKEKVFRSYISEMLMGVDTNKSQVVMNSVANMQRFLANNDIDYASIYQDLFADEKIPIWGKVLINKYATEHIGAMTPAMNMMGMVYEMIQVGKKIREITK